MFGTLNNEEIEQVFYNNIIGRIGCHADGKTYVVPISYAYDGDCIYAHTYEGMKISIMRKNPEVCFQADNMQNMANWQSVIAWGTFEELTDPEKIEGIVFRICIHEKSGKFETMDAQPK
jgi:nitroimidazol reductase NimA-like FMN-containing flavoprotein (pyridoxamine 5'-phosphate oxidase superfamily)